MAGVFKKKQKLSAHCDFDKLFKDSNMEETEEILHYVMDYVTPAMKEEAQTQLNETDEIRARALDDLRFLIKKEKNLVIPMDDDFLVRYLRARKFDVKKAFKLLQNYWTFRKKYKHILDISNPQKVKEMMLKNYVGPMLYRDKKGCAVMVLRFGMWNTNIDTYEDLFRAVTGFLIHSIQFNATQICGYRVIFDLRGLSWMQVKLCTPSNMMLFIQSTQFCFPGRYKGIHILIENKFFKFVWGIVYPLLTEKLKRRIMLHGSDLEPLKNYIHPSILPCEFGGKAGPFDMSKFEEIFDKDKDKVMEQLNYGYKDK